MHNDYKNGKKNTEMESLTAYVVKTGKELGVETPTFAYIYAALLQR
jgi:ketopantoate reductase